MERSLLLGASALGVVGWLLSFALSRTERGASPWHRIAAPCRWTALVLPVVVFLLTLPSSPPFSGGQGLGRGFLIGGIAALLAVIVVSGARRSERAIVNAAVVAAPLWIVVPATTIPLLTMRGVLMDAMMGVAIGFLSVIAVAQHGLVSDASEEEEDLAGARSALLSGAGFCVALAFASGLGAYRGNGPGESTRWAAAAIVSGVAVPLAVWIASLPTALLLGPLRKIPGAATVASRSAEALKTDARREFAAVALRFVLGALVLLVADRLLATRLLAETKAFYAATVGVALGFLSWWLAADESRSVSLEGAHYRGPLAVLAALGAAMVCFNFLLGFGIALMSVALWLPVSLALCQMLDRSRPVATAGPASTLAVNRTLWSIASFAVVLAGYRFLSTRFQTELRGVTLADHYALFGFMAGATIPAIVSGVAFSGAPDRHVGRLLRLIGAGVLALSLPALVLIMWKAKATLALLAGAALAAAGFDWLYAGSAEKASSPRRLFVPLMALAVCLALSQWSPQVLDVSTLTREQKIGILKWLLGGIAAVLVAVDLTDRVRRSRKRDESGPATSGMEAAQ